jgi:6-pyruvoyltetrahydropterin/6-carboxytetrahydropterin synthase
MLIGKRFHFDAAHSHPHEGAGKCHNLHGHTYHVEVVLQGHDHRVQGPGPQEGMLLDLGLVGSWWKGIMDPLLDHSNLNDVLPTDYLPSTIENIAAFILSRVRVQFPETASVRVQEGETQWAIAIA